MRQQVNLYQPILRKEKRVFSALAMLQLTGVFVAGLLAIYAYGLWKGQALEAELQRLEQQRAASTERLERLAEEYPPRAVDATLKQRRDALAAEKERKQRALGVLSRDGLGNTEGFAGHFEALARQRVGGLWLTRVRIYRGGGEIALEGTTLSDQLVPEYLQMLSGESVFRGTEFRKVQLMRDSDRSWEIDFTLRTAPGGEDGEP